MLLAAASTARGSTVEAKSVELTDVKSAIVSAREGDTVIVPSGTASWTSPLVITKGITLQGATSINGSSSSPAVTDRTIVLDDVPRQSRRQASAKQQQRGSQQPGAFFSCKTSSRGQTRAASRSNAAAVPQEGHMPGIVMATLKPADAFRLTGFTFKYG